MLFSKIKKLSMAMGIVAACSLAACNPNNTTETDKTATDSTEVDAGTIVHAQAVISGTYADTTVDGTASFDVENGKVKLSLSITVPAKANQSVAVHLHEHGGCGNMGKDAHGHWNPTNKAHGKWGEGEFHSGDIGNVQLDAEGKGSLSLETDLWTIGGDASTNILDKSVIIHGGVDDYKTQPTGDAGGRIGCGIIVQ